MRTYIYIIIHYGIEYNNEAYSCICIYELPVLGFQLCIIHVQAKLTIRILPIGTSVSTWQWTEIVAFAVPMGQWQTLEPGPFTW